MATLLLQNAENLLPFVFQRYCGSITTLVSVGNGAARILRLDQFKNGDKVYGSADQTGNNWYDIYIKYALDKGIISAAPSAPNGVITRADAAIILPPFSAAILL